MLNPSYAMFPAVDYEYKERDKNMIDNIVYLSGLGMATDEDIKKVTS